LGLEASTSYTSITITEFQDFSRQNNDHHFAVRLRTQRDPQLLLAVARAGPITGKRFLYRR
jgi:hypothetical protein